MKESSKYKERWNTPKGQRFQKEILDRIEKGAGEHFLDDIEDSGFLEGRELRGITIFLEKEIRFPEDDNFKGVDFSYAEFYHGIFRNAAFFGTSCEFTRFYNCQFVNCIFACAGFYGCTLEKVKFINCDFYSSSMTNCDFREVVFQSCFIPKNPFFDCKFDGLTALDDPIDKPSRENVGLVSESFSKSHLADIFKGIKEGYVAGDVTQRARRYFFKQKQSITRYNSKALEKVSGYFLEFIAGYGLKWIRVLLTMMIVFLFFFVSYTARLACSGGDSGTLSYALSEGLLLSAGAFFTFGANIHHLYTLGLIYKIMYIMESFLGISLTALFITVLANLWFREK